MSLGVISGASASCEGYVMRLRGPLHEAIHPFFFLLFRVKVPTVEAFFFTAQIGHAGTGTHESEKQS